MANIEFEIKEHLGVLSENNKGWTKELTLTSWNNRQPSFDIRSWDPDYQKMSKGLTFTQEELVALRDLLNEMEL
ncbi:YdbC family protein [Fundicoccus culcitae]|uniref:PC4/YdbC family ssDNA-binding protein n=1 Tax=Fundicoccus culcitae TaxID=2969821 RepID=A0ABY5P490_9LACT|nr:PC4/YdbC family ssDNA-binding protein [Fundicoccus culcitae]UUX33195.1 PC4/YdbC family ssDNA-binding protein [Fundicoccus culcitae]